MNTSLGVSHHPNSPRSFMSTDVSKCQQILKILYQIKPNIFSLLVAKPLASKLNMSEHQSMVS